MAKFHLYRLFQQQRLCRYASLQQKRSARRSAVAHGRRSPELAAKRLSPKGWIKGVLVCSDRLQPVGAPADRLKPVTTNHQSVALALGRGIGSEPIGAACVYSLFGSHSSMV
jgi:hypothetical protein